MSFKGKFWIVVLLTFGAVIVTSLIAHLKPYRYFAPINHPSADHVLYYQYMRKPVDVLIFGSSKVKYGVRMEIVREELDRAGMNQVTAAKLAVPGIVILGEYLVIRDLLRGPFRPRLLVLEVAERNFSRNAGRVINDLQAFGTPRDMASFLWREARPSERGKVLEGIIRGPYFTFNMVARMAAGFLGSKGRNAILETKPDLTPEMLEVLEQDTWKKKREMLCGIEADSVMERYDITPYMRNVTSALIRTVRERGIDLVLVHFPYEHDYPAYCLAPGAKRKYDQFITGFSRKTGVEFMYYPARSRYVGKREMYGDPEHLNKLGGMGFSRELVKDILIPHLKGKNLAKSVNPS